MELIWIRPDPDTQPMPFRSFYLVLYIIAIVSRLKAETHQKVKSAYVQ